MHPPPPPRRGWMHAYMRSADEDGCTRRRRLRRGWSAERSARRVKCEGERVELSMALGQSGRLLSRGDDKMRASNENEPIVASQGRASCVGSTRLHMHAPANAHMHASALVLREGGGQGRRDGRRTFCGGEDGDEAGALGMQGPWGRRQRADARHRPLRGYGPLSGGCGHSSVTLLGVGGAWFLVALSPRCISWCCELCPFARSRCLDLYGVLDSVYAEVAPADDTAHRDRPLPGARGAGKVDAFYIIIRTVRRRYEF